MSKEEMKAVNVNRPSISNLCFNDALSLRYCMYWRCRPWLTLGKHINNDHIAGLVVHHKVERMSSNLVGIEVHGVITWVELISVVLRTGCAGLNHLIEACRPSNGRIGDKL